MPRPFLDKSSPSKMTGIKFESLVFTYFGLFGPVENSRGIGQDMVEGERMTCSKGPRDGIEPRVTAARTQSLYMEGPLY